MKKNKSVLLTALLLAATMILSACGGSASSSAPASTAASGATSTAASGSTAPAAEGMMVMPLTGNEFPAPAETVDFNYVSVPGSTPDVFMSMVDRIGELEYYNTGSKTFQADELDTQLNLALTSGGDSPYQTFQISMRYYNEQASSGLLLPLTDYIEKYEDVYNFSDIPQATWDTLTKDGEIYAIPTASNNQHLFYRTDLFEKYELEVPTTVQELLDVCEVLQTAEEIQYPLALVYGSGNGAGTEFVNMMSALGGVFFDEDNNPTFNDETGVEAVELMKQLYSYMPPSATTYTNDDVMVLLQTGAVAISNIWTTRAPFMDDEEVSSVVGLIGYAAAPVVEEGMPPMSYLSPEMLSIPANPGSDPESVFLAVAEMSSYEAQTELFDTVPVTRQQVITDSASILEERPNLIAANETAVMGALPPPDYPYFSSVMNLIGTHVATALTGELTAQQALDNAAAECIVILEDEGYL